MCRLGLDPPTEQELHRSELIGKEGILEHFPDPVLVSHAQVVGPGLGDVPPDIARSSLLSLYRYALYHALL